MEYYAAIKKNEILPFATTWMDLEDIMLSQVGQTEKDKYCMISLIYEILKKKNYELTDTEDRLVVPRGSEWVKGWAKCKKGVKRYKLPVVK